MRLIDAEGENRGVVPLAEAQEIANAAALDLVEVAADARPPVCRIMDYGKWRYEQEQKAKQARRHQSTITIKEIKFRPKIDPHDYATKKGHVERFLRHRDKVKITIMFRGRELLHPERGEQILLRLADELKDLAIIESRPEPGRPQHGDDDRPPQEPDRRGHGRRATRMPRRAPRAEAAPEAETPAASPRPPQPAGRRARGRAEEPAAQPPARRGRDRLLVAPLVRVV